MTYDEALAYIAALAPRGWRMGLDRMQEFAQRAGLSSSLGAAGGPQFIHIAGTNGKGSVTAFVQAALTEAGYRTGGFFSPYVYDPRERVQIGCELIAPEQLAAITAELAPVADSLSQTEYGEVTEFEFKTALGLRCWQLNRCEWVALEVGLGGRLDATNIVTPGCAVITSIALDHMQILGGTLGAIAREKGGIIKPGVPVVVGSLPEEAMEVVVEIAGPRRSRLWRLGCEILARDEAGGLSVSTPLGSVSDISVPLPGEHMKHNAALAVAAIHAAGLEADPTAIARGISQAKIPGRFERRLSKGREIILDGAHNADAARALAETFAREWPGRKAVLVTGMTQGHDPADFYRELAPIACAAHVCPIDFHRSVAPGELASHISQFIPATSHDSVREGIAGAMAHERSQPILVTGSFYLLGEVAAEI